MSCRWRLLGMKKKCDQFQNLEGKSQHFVLSVGFHFCLSCPYFCNELLWVHNIK